MPKKISQLNSDDKKGEFGVELIVDMRVTRGKVCPYALNLLSVEPQTFDVFCNSERVFG